MATATLTPNADHTTAGWTSTGASFYTEVDETLAGTDGDTTKVSITGVVEAGTSITLYLSNTPADFATPSAVTVYINAKKVVSSDDNVFWGGAALTGWSINENTGGGLLVASATGTTTLTTSYAEYSRAHTGTPSGSKANWDDARLFLRFTGSATGMADAVRSAHVSTVSVVCTYTPSITAALTGTITAGVNESDIVTGGKTAIITLTGDTWIAAGAGSFDLQRDEIIAGFDSAQSEALGWDLVPKALQSLGGVARTSDTVVTVTWDAFATYDITATETVTCTVPTTATVGGTGPVASPTFTITHVSGAAVKDFIGSNGFLAAPR